MIIRRATVQDAEVIRTLNLTTIKIVNAKDYSDNQIAVWTSFDNIDKWRDAIVKQKFWVVLVKSEIAGFGSLDVSGLFDFLYVHHSFQRIGVASILSMTIESEARKQLNKKVFASVSITAQPFFLSKGYLISRMETKKVKGENFVNAIMEKELM